MKRKLIVFILSLINKKRLKKRLERIRICRIKLKQEIKPYDSLDYYE